MEITKQYSENECGVCVINSFVKHFHNHDKKIEIFTEANLSQGGMSLFEFEQLGKKFGLEIESFEMEYEEFLENYENKYCATVLNNHFLIVKKRMNWVTVFDSAVAEPIRYSIDEFKKHFSKIIIDVRKNPTVQTRKYLSKNPIENTVWKEFSILFALEIIFFSLSIASAKFFSFLIEWCIVPMNIKNGFFICLLFLMVSVLSCFSLYLKNIFSSKLIKDKSEKLFFLATEKIKHKPLSFFKKISQKELFSLETIILGVVNFYSVEIPFFISNVIFAIISLIILVGNNFSFLFPITFLIIICFLVTLYEIKNKKIFLSSGIKNHNSTYEIIGNHINKNDFTDPSKLNQVYHDSNKLNTRAKNFSSYLSMIFFLLETSFSILSSYICCFLISFQLITISVFLFLSSIMSIFTHCLFSVFSFLIKKNEFNIFKDTLDKIVFTCEGQWTAQSKISKIKKISYRDSPNSQQKILNGSTVDRILIENVLDQKCSNKFLINDKPVADYSWDSFCEAVKIFKPFSSVNIDFNLLGQMPKLFFDVIKKHKLDLSSQKTLSLDEVVFINFLLLLNLKSKILVIDSPKYLIKNNAYYCEINLIIKSLKQSNFILFL